MFLDFTAENRMPAMTVVCLLTYVCVCSTFYSLMVTWCTNRLNIQELYFVHSAHTVFMCFVFISEQTATFTPYYNNW